MVRYTYYFKADLVLNGYHQHSILSKQEGYRIHHHASVIHMEATEAP